MKKVAPKKPEAEAKAALVVHPSPRQLWVVKTVDHKGGNRIPQLVAAEKMRGEGSSASFFDDGLVLVAYFPDVEYACLASLAPKAILGDITASGAGKLSREIAELLPRVIEEKGARWLHSRNSELESELRKLREELKNERAKSVALAAKVPADIEETPKA